MGMKMKLSMILFIVLISGCGTTEATIPTSVVTPNQTSTSTFTPTFTATSTITMTPTEAIIYTNDWSMWGYDIGNTFWNREENQLTPPLTKIWSIKTNNLVEEGMVSVGDYLVLPEGSHSGTPYQLDALDVKSGLSKWVFPFTEPPSTGTGSPANCVTPVIYDNIIVTGGQSLDNIYAVDINSGKMKWAQNGLKGILFSHPKAEKGVVFVLGDNTVGAFNIQTGNQIWQHAIEARESSIALVTDYVLIGGWGQRLSVLRKSNGESYWISPGVVGHQILVDYPNVFLIYSGDHPVPRPDEWGNDIYNYPYIASFNIESKKKNWETEVFEPLDWWAPMAYSDDKLYLGSGSRLYAINPQTGEIVNEQNGYSVIMRLVGANDFLYICDLYDGVYALDIAELSQTWKEAGSCSNLIIANNRLFSKGSFRQMLLSAYTN
jgi:outer membrane protein assembly factor BamB